VEILGSYIHHKMSSLSCFLDTQIKTPKKIVTKTEVQMGEQE